MEKALNEGTVLCQIAEQIYAKQPNASKMMLTSPKISCVLSCPVSYMVWACLRFLIVFDVLYFAF